MARADEARKKLARLRMQEDFGLFFKQSWKVMAQRKFVPSWHYEYMCEYIVAAETGLLRKQNPNFVGLQFCVPPGTAKSKMITVAFPAWIQARDASTRIGCISHSDDISIPMSVERRSLVQSAWFKYYWPEYQIREDSNLKSRQDNNAGGVMVSGTRKSGVSTGIRLTHCIMDDLLKAHEAYSDAFRTEANDLYDKTLRSRGDDNNTFYFVSICQRLHPTDIVGFLKKIEPERWVFVEIPLVCEKDTEYVFPVSGKTYLRKQGELLLPERYPKETILGYQKNTHVWEGQYQQRPSPLSGYIFKPDTWKFYEKAPECDNYIMSVDAAFKDKPENDYVAIHVYGVLGSNRFLLDRRTEHLDYPATKQAIWDMRKKWPQISYVLIEDKANGSAVIQELQREMTGVIAIEPEGGKEARAHAAAADVYSGNVYLPNPDADMSLAAMISNFSDYNGEGTVDHDDDIDAFSQFINWARCLFNGASEWLDAEYVKVKKAESPQSVLEACPSCKKPLSYMAGVWVCVGCGSRGSQVGTQQTVTRVGF